MGNEIRRVPADWVHPVYTKETANDPRRIGQFIPLHDDDYETAAEAWMQNYALWREGNHPDQGKSWADQKYFWDYDPPPSQDVYRERKWSESEATHYQMYQTVSEGSPVSPVFATLQELAEYLIANGDFWDQKRGDGGWSRESAEGFVKTGFAMSMIVTQRPSGAVVSTPRDMEYPK